MTLPSEGSISTSSIQGTTACHMVSFPPCHSAPESCSSMAVCVLQIWIVGILALSAFWCLLSLLAISRLERRLPSEMQDQLEFHTAFSGLWPKAQGATAGEKAISNCVKTTFGRAAPSHTTALASPSVHDAAPTSSYKRSQTKFLQ